MKKLTEDQKFHQEFAKYIDAYLALKRKALPDLTLWGQQDMAVVSDYMARIGRRGGMRKVCKGIGKMTPEQRHEMSVKAAAARWAR